MSEKSSVTVLATSPNIERFQYPVGCAPPDAYGRPGMIPVHSALSDDARFKEVLDRCRCHLGAGNGKMQWIWVYGAPGVGKSCLCDLLAHDAGGKGYTVIAANCLWGASYAGMPGPLEHLQARLEGIQPRPIQATGLIEQTEEPASLIDGCVTRIGELACAFLKDRSAKLLIVLLQAGGPRISAVQELWRALQGIAQQNDCRARVAVVIESRDRMMDQKTWPVDDAVVAVYRHELGALDEKAARELAAAMAGSLNDSDLTPEVIVHDAGTNPYLLWSYVQVRNRGEALRDWVAEVAEKFVNNLEESLFPKWPGGRLKKAIRTMTRDRVRVELPATVRTRTGYNTDLDALYHAGLCCRKTDGEKSTYLMYGLGLAMLPYIVKRDVATDRRLMWSLVAGIALFALNAILVLIPGGGLWRIWTSLVFSAAVLVFVIHLLARRPGIGNH